MIDLTQEENKCRFCGKCYASPYNLKRHAKLCPMKDNQTVLMQMLLKEQEIELLKEQNRLLKEQNSQVVQITNNNITNNTLVQNNMYVNVTICSFGNEDLNKLDSAKVMELLKNHTEDFMPKMFEHVHANPDHPEFHNVFYDPKKEKAIVFAPISATEMSWQVREFREVSDNIAEKIKDHIRPGSGPYFDMAAREKDYETSNRIIHMVNEAKWDSPEVLDQNKESLAKVTKNKEFRDLVGCVE